MRQPDVAEFVEIASRRFKKIISEEEIRTRVAELSEQIVHDFSDRRPIFLIVLNGAFIFGADLLRTIPFVCETMFMRLSSYTGTSSSGWIKTIMGLSEDISGRDIVVVEDIIDSGRTIQFLKRELMGKKAASVSTVCMLLKPDCLEFPLENTYVGFEIPNEFVVGYGLDLNGLGRNLSGIYQLDEQEDED
jgi:hypoxanthine phosphoribosyltransferase